jgi:hypothetical protein
MQNLSEFQNGPFKVIVRRQEINHSGEENVDICVTTTSSSGFPTSKYQCFLNGYDFDGLTIGWKGPRVIVVSFSSGRVSHFSNTASVDPGGGTPEEFHTLLCDGCIVVSHNPER